jgi:hypothetical protein
VVVERGEEALWFLSFLGARGDIPFAGAFLSFWSFLIFFMSEKGGERSKMECVKPISSFLRVILCGEDIMCSSCALWIRPFL